MYAIASGGNAHINSIDGLRAFAVLFVIAFHANSHWLPGGFVGVDLFFVISGYVVTKSIAGKEWVSARDFFTTFLARRIARIYPALIACLLVVAAVQTLLVPKAWLNDTVYKAGMAAFFGLSNFALVFFNDGYFSPRSEFNPFTHTWSLGVEEQFYVLFALTWWFSRKNPRVFFAITGCTIIATLIYSAFLTSSQPAQAYYLLPSRWWELASGALLAYWHHLRRHTPIRGDTAVFFVVAGLSLIGYSAINAKSAEFPFPDAIPVIAGGLLCIHGLILRGERRSYVLDSAPMVHVGKLSYSLYLWHWPVIVFFKWTVGLQSWINYISCLSLVVILSYVSFYLVENPLRHGLFKSFSPYRLVVGGIATMVAGSTLTLAMNLWQPWLSLSVTANSSSWYSHSNKLQTEWETRSEKPVIYAFGDSHAGMLAVALQQLEQQMGVETKIISQSGCAVASLRTAPSTACQRFIESVIPRLIDRFKPGDVVILASLRSQRLSDQWGLIPDSPSNSLVDEIELKKAQLYADSIVQRLTDAGFKVVLSAPLPVFSAPAFRCSDTFNRSNPVCTPGLEVPRSEALKWRESTINQIHALKLSHPTMVVWDPFFDVCPDSTCKAFDKEPLFFDGDHLTGAGNLRVLPSLTQALTGQG